MINLKEKHAVGHLNLITAVSGLEFDPVYKLHLTLDPPSAGNPGGRSFEEVLSIHSPLKGQSATFSVKFKARQYVDIERDLVVGIVIAVLIWDTLVKASWRIKISSTSFFLFLCR
jgi:hypothetical protein